MTIVRKRIILAGAGHGNIVALRRLALAKPDAEFVLVNQGAKAWYTGALPGLIRGDISARLAYVDLPRLAEQSGARFIDDRMTNFEGNRLNLESGEALSFDILAISTGAAPNGGVKPIEKFLAWLDIWDRMETPIIGILGAGPAGVELALALRHRLGVKARITLRAPNAALLPGAPAGVIKTLRAELLAARIPIVPQFTERMDHLIHAYAGEPAHEVRKTLQLTTHDHIFATGDAAKFPTNLPRSGAVAVRQGKTLAANIRHLLAGTSPETFRPPPATLAILSLNADEATAWYGPLHWTGHLPMALKQWLDGRWVK